MVTIIEFEKWALNFPGSEELPHFEKRSFRVNKKIFATLDEKNNRACLMFSPMDQSLFCAHDLSVIYPVPNKWGTMGATFVELKTVRKTVMKAALESVYRKLATAKLLEEFEKKK